MIKVFDETALDILPLPNGFIVSCRRAVDENSGKMVVGYNLVSFEKGTMNAVTRNVYLLAKFGQYYERIEAALENPFYWNVAQLPNDKQLCVYPDGSARMFDTEARLLWNGEFKYGECGAADVVFLNRDIWCSFPEEKCVARFDPTNMRQTLRIGDMSSKFGKPCGLFAEGGTIYVCDSELGKVWTVDTESYTVSEYAEFLEPVYQFLKIDGVVLVRLESGVYKI